MEINNAHLKTRMEHFPRPWIAHPCERTDKWAISAANRERVTLLLPMDVAKFIVNAVNYFDPKERAKTCDALLKAAILARRELDLIGHGGGVLRKVLDEAIVEAAKQ